MSGPRNLWLTARKALRCACVWSALHAAQPPPFEALNPRSIGIGFVHANSPTANKYLPETMGAGVALIDFDNDGNLDLFFTNGARIDGSETPAKQDPKYWNRLYRNNGDGTFTDVTERAGLAGPETGFAMGVAVGDFDNDGWEDLYVTAHGANTLYRNRGNGTFENVTAKAGVAAAGWSSSAGFFDYNNDGFLDLFVCRYLDWSFAKDVYCGEKPPGVRAYCHPDNFQPVANLLFRNNRDGTFTDVSVAAGISAVKGKALGVAFADYDGDGFTDIYVANDSVMGFLFHNLGNGQFKESALLAGAGFNEDGNPFAGMGVDFADYNNDGRPDIFVTNLSNQMYALFRNLGGGHFEYATNESGLGRATLPHSGWSGRFIDFDNDGWKDIFAAQGHVLDTIEHSSPNLRYRQPPLLLRNRKGIFERVTGGDAFNIGRPGRGAAFGDIDNDGKIDAVVSNLGEAPTILRNTTANRHNWLSLRLIGRRANRDGIGCKVKLTRFSGQTQFYEVQTAAGYLSASDRRLLMGLETDTVAAKLEIRWPGGRLQTLSNIKAGQQLIVKEPAE